MSTTLKIKVRNGLVTSKGQVVIPIALRERFHIKPGSRVCFFEKEDGIVLKLMDANFIAKNVGILKTRGKLSRALLRDRKKDALREKNR